MVTFFGNFFSSFKKSYIFNGPAFTSPSPLLIGTTTKKNLFLLLPLFGHFFFFFTYRYPYIFIFHYQVKNAQRLFICPAYAEEGQRRFFIVFSKLIGYHIIRISYSPDIILSRYHIIRISYYPDIILSGYHIIRISYYPDIRP